MKKEISFIKGTIQHFSSKVGCLFPIVICSEFHVRHLVVDMLIQISPIYLAGCHDLIGPVSSSKITDLALKILKYSSSRLKTDDFNQLIDSLKSLDAPTLPETPITDNPSTNDDHSMDENESDDTDVKKENPDDYFPLDNNELSKSKAESIGLRIAHACRLNPEIMGLLCSVLPPSVAETAPLRDSNSSLRAGESLLLCSAIM